MPRGVSWPRAGGTGGDRAGIFRTATGILARDVSSGRLVAETSRGAHANFARIPEKVKQGTPRENAPHESLRVTEKLLHGQEVLEALEKRRPPNGYLCPAGYTLRPCAFDTSVWRCLWRPRECGGRSDPRVWSRICVASR